ncbi:hypothetical protein GN956_G26719 [Arapaima gigas]
MLQCLSVIPQGTILAFIHYYGSIGNKTAENVVHVSTRRLETIQCLNITYHAIDVKGEEIQTTYTVSASQPEVNANKPGPPEQKVSSVTAKIIGSIVSAVVLLIILLLCFLWKKG